MSTPIFDSKAISHLDFPPRCGMHGEPAHVAALALRCRGCGDTGLWCWHHLDNARSWTLGADVVECIACHLRARSFAHVFEVVPL